MKARSLPVVLLAGLLSIGIAISAVAQTATQDHDAHHPGEAQSAPQSATSDKAPPAGAKEKMPGMMGTMPPEMMQRMMPGRGGMPGMMGQGGMPMESGMMTCPMMGDRAAAGMQGMTDGAAVLYGVPRGAQKEMTPERVRTFLDQRLTQHGNRRLKIGEIATAADGSITAEIVTVDGSLVQKLAFNRYPGLVRQITE
ncbi:hypothetical protein [Hyphomicrobium sp. CS1BSMeth3]|jgi:hypothetical protein|uniref:hypothetical protein n=1 Tax=Hyphomicrobium sp. CS1BSMeth3 TaxID=1892844 RepID=UPI00116012D1|nr:hypothetical protein [Hyphomicrobium sp. CS1BSMeth3]